MAAEPGLHLVHSAGQAWHDNVRHGYGTDDGNEQPFKVLLSFWYYRTTDVAAFAAKFPRPPMVFADSGAYSAAQDGATIDVHDYADWLDTWRQHFTVMANLDVIHNAEASAANQAVLEDRYDLPVLPVFHTGTPMEVLEGLLDRHAYIALGGQVGLTDRLRPWTVECFQRARRTGTVFHGFGQTQTWMLANLPWYSVDSSSWGKGHRYGQIGLWDGRRFQVAQVGDTASVYRIGGLVRAYGFDPADFADRDRYHRREMVKLSAASWRRYEQHLRDRHGPIAMPGAGDGMHVYLADGSADNLIESAAPRRTGGA